MVLVAIASWILPGAGHFLVGDRKRGIIFLVAIALAFWIGIAVGGVKNTVSPSERSLWFVAQIFAGGHSLVALAWGHFIPDPAKSGQFVTDVIGYGRTEEVSVIYTAVAGMLNILVILDALVRAEQKAMGVSIPSTPTVPAPAEGKSKRKSEGGERGDG